MRACWDDCIARLKPAFPNAWCCRRATPRSSRRRYGKCAPEADGPVSPGIDPSVSGCRNQLLQRFLYGTRAADEMHEIIRVKNEMRREKRRLGDER